MDKFVETVGRGAGACADYGKGKGLVMGYYDGNTVTGAVELRPALRDERQLLRHDVRPLHARRAQPGLRARPTASRTDAAPAVHAPSSTRRSATRSRPATRATPATPPPRRIRTNKNIGDLLNAKNVSWGWFQGGFARLHGHPHQHRRAVTSKDYIPHHEPFQYYASTANPQHLPPGVRRRDRPHRPGQPPVRPDRLLAGRAERRQPAGGQLPQGAGLPGRPRRLLRPAGRADVPGRTRSTALQKSPDWKDTAVVIAYDDSDGWYDHQMGPIVNQSQRPGHRRADRRHRLRHEPAAACRRLPGPLRLRPAAAAAGDLAVRQDQLRRPHDHRPDARSCGSSRTTGAPAGSATPRSTRRPAAWRTCSTSAHSAGAGSRTLLLDPSTGQPQHGNGH